MALARASIESEQNLLEELAMTSIADREAWPTAKPASRPTTSRREIVWIALVAIAAIVIVGAASYFLPVPSEMTFFVAP